MKLSFLFTLLFLFYSTASQEICNNGKDDDGDGLADLKDPDCQCPWKAPQNILLNPSFETYSHCPTYNYSQDYNIIDNWPFGVVWTGNLEHHHSLSCKYDSTVFMQAYSLRLPLPDGKAYVMFLQDGHRQENSVRKAYIAQCLQTPLLQGGKYTFTFYAGRFKSISNNDFNPLPIQVGIFGHSDCAAVPFGNRTTTGNGCPTNHSGWVLLGRASVYSKGEWVQAKIDITIPKEIHVIAVGPDCSTVPVGADATSNIPNQHDNHIFNLDHFQLTETKDFNFQHIQAQSGSSCTGGYVLKAPAATSATYQWYRDSIAVVGATGPTYSVLDSVTNATYNVRLTTPSGCQITEPFAVQRSPLYNLKMPADTFICKNDTLTLAKPVTGVQFRWNGNRDSLVRIHEPGTYLITASDTLGCTKDFTVKAEYKECTACTVFVPSAFTPNGDGKNDVLRGRINCPVDKYHFQVYNRWGQKVFESRNPDTGWDGTYRGEKAPAEVYVYYVKFKHSSFEKNFKLVKGTLLIIR